MVQKVRQQRLVVSEMTQATKMAIADQKDVRIRSGAVQPLWRLSIPTKVQKGFFKLGGEERCK